MTAFGWADASKSALVLQFADISFNGTFGHTN